MSAVVAEILLIGLLSVSVLVVGFALMDWKNDYESEPWDRNTTTYHQQPDGLTYRCRPVLVDIDSEVRQCELVATVKDPLNRWH